MRIAKILGQLEEGFIAFLLAAMVLVTFSQVVARYVFNSGAVWALELTTFLFAWLVLFGISYGIRTNSHIGVDAFVKLFSSARQRMFAFAALAAGLTYGAIMLLASWNYVSRMYQIGIEAVDLPIPRWIPLSMLPIGFALVLFRLLQAGWGVLHGEESGFKLGDEGKDAMEQFGVDDEINDNKSAEP
ncbi:MAG: TRAP transporter small permease [Alphaproteobacteria bacterium]